MLCSNVFESGRYIQIYMYINGTYIKGKGRKHRTIDYLIKHL